MRASDIRRRAGRSREGFVAKFELHPIELLARPGFLVTNLALPSCSPVRFYNKRSMAEQWIKEGKQSTQWTRLSCRRFRANEVRLQLAVLAYNLWRRLGLPRRIKSWSLTSLQQRLMKTGGRLVNHPRYLLAIAGRGACQPEALRRDADSACGAPRARRAKTEILVYSPYPIRRSMTTSLRSFRAWLSRSCTC